MQAAQSTCKGISIGSVTDILFWNCRKGAIPDGFKPLYDKLILVRNHLEKLSVTHAWALREADLYDYHRTLDRIDDLRVNGNWVDDQGNEADVYVRRVSDTNRENERGPTIVLRGSTNKPLLKAKLKLL